MLVISDLNEIKRHEKLLDNHNKYGLSLLKDVTFGRQGYYIGDEYYLYNCFFDISIGRAIAEIPLTIELFNLISNIDIYMRCDKLLSVPKTKAICTATTDFQKFRGISLLWDDIEKLVYGKEIVVHGNPKTLNKLLLVIKKDEEQNGGMPYDFIQEVHNIVPWTTFDINCIPLTENMVVSQVSLMDLETTKPIPIFWLKVLIITIISLVTVIIKIRRGKIKQDSEEVL